jgi:YidC/Oxa1 family membrane protein insertase
MHDTIIVGAGIKDPNISYGLAIILFTIVIRLLLLPLNIRQMKSQVKMQEVQPELKKLQEKYKNDPQKSQQEMMKLYKEKGVNPMGGCLPLLVQLPILWALFYVFRNIQPVDPVTQQNITVSFLWLPNLFAADPYKILPILAGVTQYISALLMPMPTDSAQAKQTSTMNIAMSVMMVFMSWSFTSGLVVYWVTQNIIQMGQNLLIKKVLVKKED